MKIDVLEDNTFVVYLNKYYIKEIENINKDNIQKYLKTIFLCLKKKYGVNIYSYFNIDCYINKSYGLILEVREEPVGFHFFTKKTDMKLTFYNNSKILYNIDDYFIKDILKNNDYKLYIRENQFFLDMDNLDEKESAYIIENTKKIIYGENIQSIINN